MANKKFSSKIVQRWDVNFATTPITAGSYITLNGALPKNCVITGGWAVFPTIVHDADAGDDTTMSVGYTGTAAGLYAATAVSNFVANAYLKLLPGTINIGSGQAITTVDTPAEAVAIGRVSGDTFSNIVLTAEKRIILTAGSGQDINSGTMTIWVEYLKY